MALAARLPTDGARIDCQGLKSQPDGARGTTFGREFQRPRRDRPRFVHSNATEGGIRQDSGEIALGHWGPTTTIASARRAEGRSPSPGGR